MSIQEQQILNTEEQQSPALTDPHSCLGLIDYSFNPEAHKLDATTWGAATKGKIALWNVIIQMEYNSQDVTLYEKEKIHLCKYYNIFTNIYINSTYVNIKDIYSPW